MGARIVRMAEESEGDLRDLRQVRPQVGESRLRRIATVVALVPVIGLALMLTLALVYSVVTPPSTLMLGRWLTGKPVEHEAIPFDAVAPALVQAVMASEDQRFCQHRGVDWESLREVAEDENGPSRGASTITMQVVKNVFLWRGRSYLRKALELPLALLVDVLWGKRRTMETYLNIAEWGEGIYGAEAASQHWFHKSASRLSRGEASMLAAVLPNPIERSAGKPSRDVRARAARIQGLLGGMDELMGCLKG